MIAHQCLHVSCVSVVSSLVSTLLSLRDAVPQISLCVLNVANLPTGDDMQ